MRSKRFLGRLAAGVAASLAAAAYFTPAPAADHRDGPFFGGSVQNTTLNGAGDINDIFLFQAPGNPNNTVLINTVSPFSGTNSPVTFSSTLVFDLRVDNTGDAVEDILFRTTFGPPDANGVQDVTLRGLPASRFPAAPGGVLARGKTGQTIPIAGGGMFRAANADDPFFFDANQFARFAAQGLPNVGNAPPVRNPGLNQFGPGSNTLAYTIELPTALLRSSASNPNIGVYASTLRNGVQIDRTGRPAINTVLIPPFPRNMTTFGERRNAFNAGAPRNDRRDFRNNMLFVLRNSFQRPENGAGTLLGLPNTALADFLLPDILTFDTSVPFNVDPLGSGGFPNGRRMRDDVIDAELGIVVGHLGVNSDNVPDDNGDRITDGTRRPDGSMRPIAFPYIGPANTPAMPLNTMN